jgi:leucyl aminopeptidase
VYLRCSAALESILVGGMGSAVGGYYIWAQIADVPDVKWLHIDLAGPARNFGISGRSTGFGVGLMGTLAYNMAKKQSATPKL